MRFELIEANFPTEEEAWKHTSAYAALLRKTGALEAGWMVTVRQVMEKDKTTGKPSWGIYAVIEVKEAE